MPAEDPLFLADLIYFIEVNRYPDEVILCRLDYNLLERFTPSLVIRGQDSEGFFLAYAGTKFRPTKTNKVLDYSAKRIKEVKP